MKWMNTQELVSILKRFPNEQVEASAYPGGNLASAHLWQYSASEKCFLHTIGAESKSYSESELLRLYGDQYWKVKPFFLRDDQEKQIALRLVEELGMLGRLEDIIEECELENVRVCEHCHHLMSEGWLVDDIRTFCSDKCLRNACSDIDVSALQTDSQETDCLAYWTKWED